jgi:hypothetical protein
MERTHRKAEQMGTAESLAVAGLQEAATTNVGTEFESIVDEAIASSPDTNLHPASITVSEGVEAVYELTEE